MASAESPKWRWEPSGPYWPKANVLLPHRLDLCTKEPAYNVRVRMSRARVSQAVSSYHALVRSAKKLVQLRPDLADQVSSGRLAVDDSNAALRKAVAAPSMVRQSPSCRPVRPGVPIHSVVCSEEVRYGQLYKPKAGVYYEVY